MVIWPRREKAETRGGKKEDARLGENLASSRKRKRKIGIRPCLMPIFKAKYMPNIRKKDFFN
ncbi:hypothetical protein X474_00525 [Dethiosulfatarculus sandiegensis]|uniref:Uncharacterized protein n=1 Tax=Dethiosulfatarculus sandiegensis TaxID=1429043 RepID=A0A0D2JCZ4_9BACT|nr:hypothetical protein X474_00525 [Dethiosulfatarculus sandiegensis]